MTAGRGIHGGAQRRGAQPAAARAGARSGPRSGFRALERAAVLAGLLLGGALLAGTVGPAWAQGEQAAARDPSAQQSRAAVQPPAGLAYKLYVGGLNALTFETRVALDDAGYDIRLQARTSGWIGSLWPFVLEGRADGTRTQAGALRPESFATANIWGDNGKRWVRMAYPGEDGLSQSGAEKIAPPDVTSEPPPGSDDRKVVPAEARADTRDPISAIYSLILGEGTVCTGSRRIFDGRRRFDVQAENLGPGEVPDSSYAVYSGPATKCRLSVQKVTGFWEKYEAKRRYPETVDVWLARVADDLPPLPVRIETETMVGSLRVHLTGVTRGAQADLPDAGLFPLKRAAAQ